MLGTEIILEMAAKKGKRLLVTSTSEVYGKSAKVPFREDDDLVLGSTYISRWSSACSKAIDEFLALAYYRERRLPVTIVRLFNTSGPRQTGRYGMVLPTFVQQALAGQPLTAFGNGQQRRCFSHVNDVVSGILACAACEKASGQIFNLGKTEEVTIGELAERIIRRVGSSSSIRHIPRNEIYAEGVEDMHRRIPDIAKAQAWFRYTPSLFLEDIINSIVEFMQTELANAVPPKISATRDKTSAFANTTACEQLRFKSAGDAHELKYWD